MLKFLSEWSSKHPVVIVLIVMIFGLCVIILAFYVKNLSYCYLVQCELWHQSLIILGTSTLSVLIFKTILTSNAVLQMVKKAIEDSFLEFSFLDGYNEEKLKIIAEKVSEKSKFIQLNFDEKKVKSIYHARKDFLENPNHKNFFIEHMTWIKTIYRNGNDIQNTIANLEIVNSGNVIIEYILETDFNSHRYPLYSDFKDDRFNDYSFNVKITDYQRSGSNLQKDAYPNYSVECTSEDDKGKRFKILIENCLQEDKFTIRISRTTIGEYLPEKIKAGRADGSLIATVDMQHPAGVRTIIFQEEIYGNDDSGRFRSNITINQETPNISPKKEESSFYITKTWEVYYDDYPKSNIEFNIY